MDRWCLWSCGAAEDGALQLSWTYADTAGLREAGLALMGIFTWCRGFRSLFPGLGFRLFLVLILYSIKRAVARTPSRLAEVCHRYSTRGIGVEDPHATLLLAKCAPRLT